MYRKVIDFGYLPNAGTKDVSHNISNLEVVTKLSGVGKRSDNIYFPIPYIDIAALTNGVLLNITRDNVHVVTGLDRSGVYAYIIIEYTKTTD